MFAMVVVPLLGLAMPPLARATSRQTTAMQQVETVKSDVSCWSNICETACRRQDGDALEGVHAKLSDALTERVMARVHEISRWDQWYAHPTICNNGHLHTILAAKTRRTPAVRYHRQLVKTPDGGTLAVDLLAGIRRQTQGNASPAPIGASGASGGLLPGAAESDGYTQFVGSPPPLDEERPMLVLASGLGGGSQDSYVRSMAVTAAQRGWQVAVVNMRACGGAPVTSPQLFSAYRGANDDLRLAVSHLRSTRLGGRRDGAPVAVIGWSNSGTILNNVLAEQATTHADEVSDGLGMIDAGVACACPLNMPANSANLRRPFHSQVYDLNLGKSLRKLWAAARDQYVDAATEQPVPVPYWAGLSRAEQLDMSGLVKAGGTFVADDELARTARTIRELDEAVTRRQYGYESVDAYYAAASSDQRLDLITAPTLLLNAYDDPIVPGASLRRAVESCLANPNMLMVLTSHGGHLGWCERASPWGAPSWVERVSIGFLEAALSIEPSIQCETIACEIFDD